MSIPNSSNNNRSQQNTNQYNNTKNVSSIFDHDHNKFSTNHTTVNDGLHHYHNEVEQISGNKINFNKNITSSGTRGYETAQHFTLSQTFKHRDEHAYSNSNSNSNNHANNASHDEDEGDSNNVNANTVQSASPTLVSPALTYSSSTRTPATLSPSTPFFGSFGGSVEDFEGPGGHHHRHHHNAEEGNIAKKVLVARVTLAREGGLV
jgi:hypothetical protein